MKKECLLSVFSFLTSTVILGIFFSSLSLGLEGKVFLTLTPLFLAILYLIGGRGTLSWLAFVCVLLCPMMILAKEYYTPFKLFLVITVPTLWALGYEEARKCLLRYLERERK